MPKYDISAAQEAKRMGVDRTTLVQAIKNNLCDGEERAGYWYTSTVAAAKWYAEHYRHAGALYSKAAGKSWARDLPRMREMIEDGKSVEEIAAALKRSVGAVKVKACKEGLKPVKIAKQARLRDVPPPVRAQPLDWYQQRRQADKDGRLRIHVAPEIKRRLVAGLARINARLPEGERVTMAQFLGWAGLAAAADPEIMERGRSEAEKIKK